MRMTVSRENGGTWFPHPPARWEGLGGLRPHAGGWGNRVAPSPRPVGGFGRAQPSQEKHVRQWFQKGYAVCYRLVSNCPLPNPPPLGEGTRLLPPAGGGWEGGGTLRTVNKPCFSANTSWVKPCAAGSAGKLPALPGAWVTPGANRYEQLMVFAYILRSRPRRRASHSVAEGLWSLNTYSALARVGGLRIP